MMPGDPIHTHISVAFVNGNAMQEHKVAWGNKEILIR